MTVVKYNRVRCLLPFTERASQYTGTCQSWIGKLNQLITVRVDTSRYSYYNRYSPWDTDPLIYYARYFRTNSNGRLRHLLLSKKTSIVFAWIIVWTTTSKITSIIEWFGNLTFCWVSILLHNYFVDLRWLIYLFNSYIMKVYVLI